MPGDIPSVIAEHLGPNSGLAATPFLLNFWGNLAVDVEAGTGLTRTPVPFGRMEAEIRRVAYSVRVQQSDDVRALERENAAVRKANDRVTSVLIALTGRTGLTTRIDWERWWAEHRGYRHTPRPPGSNLTIIEDVPIHDRPSSVGRFRWDPRIGYYMR
jgi:hypothetical protein